MYGIHKIDFEILISVMSRNIRKVIPTVIISLIANNSKFEVKTNSSRRFVAKYNAPRKPINKYFLSLVNVNLL